MKTTSTEKGRQFEDQVAELYRILGAEVIRNIEICQKKVDIFARFPIQGSSIKHRVIVECKDEKRTVNANQRVMQFRGLLNAARESGIADSAEIITRVPWGDAAKGFALTSGISLLTYDEKLAQLVDFKSYLQTLIASYQTGDPSRPAEPPLSKYFVELSGDVEKSGDHRLIPFINKYIIRWLQEVGSTRHLAVLGEFGSGKSSLCLKLAHDLAAAYLRGEGVSRIPILLNLRDFVGTIRMEAYIASFLDQECHAQNPRFELFRAMNDYGSFLLIFDGLDEMAVRVDSDTLELNLMEIEKLASADKSKVLITSRPEHFISTDEERRALRPKDYPLPSRYSEYEILRVLPWDKTRVKTFLKKRVPLIKEAREPWSYYHDRIETIKGLADLSQRPVLLEMVAKTLPKLIEPNVVINLPNLYRTYLLEEIKRQKISKGRKLLLSDADRLALLRRLAGDVYSESITAITFVDARRAIESQIKPPVEESEALTREFLTNSFLIRKGDAYHFSHKSILEYLVAARVQEQFEHGPNLISGVLLQPVIVEFLVEMELDRSRLVEWIEWTRKPTHSGARYLGGNCATLLCALSDDGLSGLSLSRANLHGANLTGANLRGLDFKGVVLSEANLRFAKFEWSDLKLAHLSNTLVSFYILSNSGAERFDGARELSEHELHDGKRLMSFLVRVANLEQIDDVRKRFAHSTGTSVAVFDRECRTLMKEYGETHPGETFQNSHPIALAPLPQLKDLRVRLLDS